MELPIKDDVAERLDVAGSQSLMPSTINELTLTDLASANWSTAFRANRLSSMRAQEWYFQCAYFGIENLREWVEVDPDRRGGVPVLKGTRFTVSEALAELAESSGVAEVSENFDLDDETLREVLNGLSMLLNQPFPR